MIKELDEAEKSILALLILEPIRNLLKIDASYFKL